MVAKFSQILGRQALRFAQSVFLCHSNSIFSIEGFEGFMQLLVQYFLLSFIILFFFLTGFFLKFFPFVYCLCEMLSKCFFEMSKGIRRRPIRTAMQMGIFHQRTFMVGLGASFGVPALATAGPVGRPRHRGFVFYSFF